MEKPTIGIVGFGAFSRLMVKHLHQYADILVSTRQDVDDADQYNCQFVSTAQVLATELIIPSIPSQFLEEYFTTNRDLLNPKALVVDVCSVKVRPVEVLQRVLPETVRILATHPMFGPASARDSLKGQRMMVYPVRLTEKEYASIKRFLSDKLQLHLIECTPEEHDQTMAYVQGLSHYIGRVMQEMKIPETELTTAAYSDLLDMKRIQGSDSWELFCSIMFENPYALKIHDEFEAVCAQLDKKLKKNCPK